MQSGTQRRSFSTKVEAFRKQREEEEEEVCGVGPHSTALSYPGELPSLSLRPSLFLRVSLSWRPGDRRFGGFCGAADVRARFRDNETGALGRKLLGNSIFVFSPRRVLSNRLGIHDTPEGTSPAVFIAGFLKD